MRRLRRAALVLALALPLGAGVVLAGGFAWFVAVAGTVATPPPQADGIVVLTGGSERVETALKLLAENRARLLLVSGVGGSTEFGALAHRAGVDPQLGERVTLGRIAASTRGNAAETAEWVETHAIRSLIVVTAGYHMPRALAELSRAMPGIALHPVPVVPPAVGQRTAATLRLLAGEYMKFLAAEAGLSGLASRGDAHPPAPREERHG
jgi:uncharacterized SAM-binding protein YcdF (DUF218 family)